MDVSTPMNVIFAGKRYTRTHDTYIPRSFAVCVCVARVLVRRTSIARGVSRQRRNRARIAVVFPDNDLGATLCGCVCGLVNRDVRGVGQPRQHVLFRQPVRRVGRRRGARSGGCEKVDGGRQTSGERCANACVSRCADVFVVGEGNTHVATRRRWRKSVECVMKNIYDHPRSSGDRTRRSGRGARRGNSFRRVVNPN